MDKIIFQLVTQEAQENRQIKKKLMGEVSRMI